MVFNGPGRIFESMEEFLHALIGGASVADVFDLCLDYGLVGEEAKGKFNELGGLLPFSNLENLSFAQHEIGSWKGLPSLENLQELNAQQNAFLDFADFPAFPALKLLDLSLNDLESLRGMPNLPRLEELQLSYNDLQTLVDLPHLPGLQSLYLNGNRRFHALEGIEGAPQLKRLSVLNTRILDWEALTQVPGLEELTAHLLGDSLVSLQTKLPSLRSLRLDLKRFSESLAFQSIPNLEHLQLKNGQHCPAITGLDRLPTLKRLELSDFSFAHLPHSLSQAIALQEVSFFNMKLESYAPLFGLEDLQKVNLGKGSLLPEAVQELERRRPEIEVEIL